MNESSLIKSNNVLGSTSLNVADILRVVIGESSFSIKENQNYIHSLTIQ